MLFILDLSVYIKYKIYRDILIHRQKHEEKTSLWLNRIIILLARAMVDIEEAKFLISETTATNTARRMYLKYLSK